MAKRKSPVPMSRVSMLLPAADKGEIERLVVETDAVSMTEVVRSAVKVYAELVRRKKAGERFVVFTAYGPVEFHAN
jgi:hypothetical protein